MWIGKCRDGLGRRCVYFCFNVVRLCLLFRDQASRITAARQQQQQQYTVQGKAKGGIAHLDTVRMGSCPFWERRSRESETMLTPVSLSFCSLAARPFPNRERARGNETEWLLGKQQQQQQQQEEVLGGRRPCQMRRWLLCTCSG
jgi:hypothetical protein